MKAITLKPFVSRHLFVSSASPFQGSRRPKLRDKNVHEKLVPKRFHPKCFSRGITPVVAIVVLLLMTVSVAGMVFLTLSSYQKETQSGSQGVLESLFRTASSYSRIESVGAGIVYLRNLGEEESSNFQVFLNGAPVESDCSPDPLPPGKVAACLLYDLSYTEGVDEIVELKILSDNSETVARVSTSQLVLPEGYHFDVGESFQAVALILNSTEDGSGYAGYIDFLDWDTEESFRLRQQNDAGTQKLKFSFNDSSTLTDLLTITESGNVNITKNLTIRDWTFALGGISNQYFVLNSGTNDSLVFRRGNVGGRGDFNLGILDPAPEFTLEVVNNSNFGGFGVSSAQGADGDIFIVDEFGYVGIGTNTPSQKLDVAGNITAEYYLGVNNSDYATNIHNRTVVPMMILPHDGVTSGANNVYFYEYKIGFGTNSKSNNHSGVAYFKLPDDYVSGENITAIVAWLDSSAGANTVDYWIQAKYWRDGGNSVATNSEDSTWTGAAGANVYNEQTWVIDGTNLLSGDNLALWIRMEDDGATDVIYLMAASLKVPVSGRD